MTGNTSFRGGRQEEGAVATVVAMLLAMGVIFGFLAISVDFGNVMFERAQLQNGADSSALSLAHSCATGAANCTTTAANIAGLNNGNAYDAQNGIQPVSGSLACGANLPAGTSPALPACPAGSNGWADCKPLPPGLSGFTNLPYVEVRTKTASAGGSTILKTLFAGSSGANTSVGACSRAAWGTPKSGTAKIPLTFSACEWFNATGNGTTYPNTDLALALNAPNIGTSSPCYTWAGHDFPGGFGWLDHLPAPNCTISLDNNNWVGVSNGVGGGNDCGAVIESYVGKIVLLPIFDCASDSKTLPCPGGAHGSSSYYHVESFAAFYLTAVDITGQVKANLPGHPTATCASGYKCIYGYFIKDYVDPGGGAIDPNAPNFGSTRVVAAG